MSENAKNPAAQNTNDADQIGGSYDSEAAPSNSSGRRTGGR
jgi:hypothetical protein